ncbi:MAG TPA: permease-like cell division protein FtsX [Nocardioidaceae bacterium]|nr:permease-like cell division protein FtsX [Nocardioidaceae bacterium]
MQITHVFSELGTGLRRNISMTISLIVTMGVSLTLVGFALMVNSQTNKTEAFFGDRLQLQVMLCTDRMSTGPCVNGEVSDAQRTNIEGALKDNPEVKSIEYQSSKEAYDQAEDLFSQSPEGRQLFEVVHQSDFAASYFVTLDDPSQFAGAEDQAQHMPGVAGTKNLNDQLEPLYKLLEWLWWFSLGIAAFLVIAAVMQVSNTIRLTAYARRREIGIMRLVGASSWHIQMPFVLESLLAAVISGLLACVALAVFVQVVIYGFVLDSSLSTFTDWIGWDDAIMAGFVTLGFAVLLGLIPTLVMTRKYLDV